MLAGLAGCTAPEESGDATEAPAEDASATGSESGGEASIIPMAETGWLTVGEDGAVFTTFLDAGGTYRDFRNGSPWQTGTWQRREDGRLCFVPDAADRVGGCWTTGELSEDGTMKATNQDDKAIELKRVTYLAPEAAESDNEQAAQASEES